MAEARMLRKGELIPSFSLESGAGPGRIGPWDYKQRSSLVVLVLHGASLSPHRRVGAARTLVAPTGRCRSRPRPRCEVTMRGLRLVPRPRRRGAREIRAPHELDGAVGVLGDGVRHGSEKEPLHGASPVRAQDREIRSPTLGLVEDQLLRRALGALADDLEAMRAVALAKRRGRLVDDVAGDLSFVDEGFVMSGRANKDRVRNKWEVGVDHEQYFDLAAFRPGPPCDFRDGCVTARRAVDGDQDLHENSSDRYSKLAKRSCTLIGFHGFST